MLLRVESHRAHTTAGLPPEPDVALDRNTTAGRAVRDVAAVEPPTRTAAPNAREFKHERDWYVF